MTIYDPQAQSFSTVNKVPTKTPFSIYIHWPFCESKCTYCNFNKYVNPRDPPHDRLVKAMTRELDFYLTDPRFDLKSKKLNSVYFGGGTPSLALPSTLASLLDRIDHHVGLSKDVEVTMEANPTSIESAKLQDFEKAGVNRLSLGIQSFNDKDLKIMGRDHSGSDAIRAITKAKKVFHKERLTFDLIFARPGQTIEAWDEELKQALELAGDHMSIYQLTMERSTPLHKASMRGEIAPLPTPDEAADMYEQTLERIGEYGFSHYEVSNYCKDQSAISRHNFSYWQGMDYLGIGPGAHGRLTRIEDGVRVRTFGEFHPNKYMDLCESEGEGIRKMVPISTRETIEELVVFGMRTRMGVPRARFEAMTGLSLDSDAGYCLTRPHSMEGGKWSLFWKPYGLYGKIDHLYGIEAWDSNDGFTGAQAFMNLVETSLNLLYLWKLKAMRETTTITIGQANLIGFSAALLTLAKTVLYWLVEAFSGMSHTGHNTLSQFILLWVIPNGLWIVFPALIVRNLGKDIFKRLASDEKYD
ncbi:hypothetical protein CLU79DRAFT_848012 [Phycomyces nitens]|nr:hypothetical protein CLU79DRAFT_848012 [Phycomyces nitens]